MLYISWMIILCGDNIKKNKFQKLQFFQLPRVKNCISRLCSNPLRAPPPP